jgi:hypothetical protein
MYTISQEGRNYGLIMVKYLSFWVRSSPVERIPDKNEVQGPTPCAPTQERIIDGAQSVMYQKL